MKRGKISNEPKATLAIDFDSVIYYRNWFLRRVGEALKVRGYYSLYLRCVTFRESAIRHIIAEKKKFSNMAFVIVMPDVFPDARKKISAYIVRRAVMKKSKDFPISRILGIYDSYSRLFYDVEKKYWISKAVSFRLTPLNDRVVLPEWRQDGS